MKRWVICPHCGHKLFLADMSSECKLEIKCHSCKMIDSVIICNGKIKAVIKKGDEIDDDERDS